LYKIIICKNEYVKIFIDSDGIYMETYKKGFPADQLHNILSSHPEIRITNFIELKNVLDSVTKQPQKFGELKERISTEIADNDIAANIVYNLPKGELDIKNRESLIKETFALLNEKGIVFGIKNEVLVGEILGGKSYVVAERIPPLNGSDAIIKMYEPKEPEPELHEDGKVNFYELKLINKVKTGDWLGERIEATEGIPGKSVKGEPIKPVKGKNYPLNYDRNTVKEIFYNSKTILYSKIDGAVNYSNGRMGVSDHLEVDGDVNFRTGNIKVNGYLTVKGTVTEGFSIEATKDIEINSSMGLANVSAITSTGGSIFIRGGIFSKGDVKIKAAKNVYTKFIDNATIISGESVHIGYYCFNSNITAKEVILDAPNGQISGGQIKAEIRVRAPIIGSEIEKKTLIEVFGFDRKALIEQLNDMFQKIGKLREEQQKLKQVLAYLEGQDELNSSRLEQYNKVLKRMFFIKGEIKSLEEKRKLMASYLKTHGEGEISAGKRIYPNCTFIIRNKKIEISSLIISTTYYAQDRELKQI
jgi:uncharacterized protein (DUF342 family)